MEEAVMTLFGAMQAVVCEAGRVNDAKFLHPNPDSIEHAPKAINILRIFHRILKVLPKSLATRMER